VPEKSRKNSGRDEYPGSRLRIAERQRNASFARRASRNPRNGLAACWHYAGSLTTSALGKRARLEKVYPQVLQAGWAERSRVRQHCHITASARLCFLKQRIKIAPFQQPPVNQQRIYSLRIANILRRIRVEQHEVGTHADCHRSGRGGNAEELRRHKRRSMPYRRPTSARSGSKIQRI
jgi:hypothetical protein